MPFIPATPAQGAIRMPSALCSMSDPHSFHPLLNPGGLLFLVLKRIQQCAHYHVLKSTLEAPCWCVILCENTDGPSLLYHLFSLVSALSVPALRILPSCLTHSRYPGPNFFLDASMSWAPELLNRSTQSFSVFLHFHPLTLDP